MLHLLEYIIQKDLKIIFFEKKMSSNQKNCALQNFKSPIFLGLWTKTNSSSAQKLWISRSLRANLTLEVAFFLTHCIFVRYWARNILMYIDELTYLTNWQEVCTYPATTSIAYQLLEKEISPLQRGRWTDQEQQNRPSHQPLAVHLKHLHTLTPSISDLSLIHIWRCRRIERCRSRWSPYH